jgi:hypothetical protein
MASGESWLAWAATTANPKGTGASRGEGRGLQKNRDEPRLTGLGQKEVQLKDQGVFASLLI